MRTYSWREKLFQCCDLKSDPKKNCGGRGRRGLTFEPNGYFHKGNLEAGCTTGPRGSWEHGIVLPKDSDRAAFFQRFHEPFSKRDLRLATDYDVAQDLLQTPPGPPSLRKGHCSSATVSYVRRCPPFL